MEGEEGRGVGRMTKRAKSCNLYTHKRNNTGKNGIGRCDPSEKVRHDFAIVIFSVEGQTVIPGDIAGVETYAHL